MKKMIEELQRKPIDPITKEVASNKVLRDLAPVAVMDLRMSRPTQANKTSMKVMSTPNDPPHRRMIYLFWGNSKDFQGPPVSSTCFVNCFKFWSVANIIS